MAIISTGFLLGNYPELSLLELQTVLNRLGESAAPTLTLPNLAVSSNITCPPAALMALLGGTIKIGAVYDLPEIKIADTIIDHLKETQSHHAGFYSKAKDLPAKTLAQTVKAALRPELNLHFRLLDKPNFGAGVLSPWSDYLIFQKEDGNFTLFITTAVQNLAHWTAKDYKRPFVSPKNGMLPPKLARILVNLGLASKSPSQTSLYDPFCGSGTILLEALDLEVKRVFGSDSSQAQITASLANCVWFQQTFKSSPSTFTIKVQDVMSLEPQSLPQPVDTICFEGYLGPSTLMENQIANQAKGLTKFYHGVFKRLKPLLKPDGVIVAALPAYVTASSNLVTLKSLIDTCEKLGYTFIVPPLIVGRSHALIKREIYLLRTT